MKISIIIPTYNERLVLEDCILSLGNQSINDFEIIVVDDGSTDGTLSILDNLSKTLPDFRYFNQQHLGAGSARNLGASHAKGNVLVFADADMTFNEAFLENLTRPILKGETKGTFSKDENVSNWQNVWARCWNINENWEAKKRHPKNYPDTQPVFRAILTSEFNKVGGYDAGGYTDDWSLSKKLGYQAVAVSGATFFHKNPDNLLEVFEHSKWVGKRKYKFGIFGYLVALVRSSFPISLIIGLYKSVVNIEPLFLIFKIVYDFGSFLGILVFMFSGKGSK